MKLCAIPASSATGSLATPVGMVSVTVANDQVQRVRIGEMVSGDSPQTPLLAEALAQFDAWFAGRLVHFDLPLAPASGEEAARLRAAIAAIPYGRKQTYGEVGAGCGAIARAVGQACKTNPFPIIIPCHRVVSAGPREYYSAGDGPRTKGWLLDFEASNLPPEQRNRLL